MRNKTLIKMESKIKNLKKEWIIILILLLIMSSIIMIKPLNDLDEIWNYNFAKNILDGNKPYKDFNMIQTPLVPIFCSIFLNLLGNELIVMRIIAILLCTTILFITYKILEILKVNKWLNCTFLIFLICILQEHFRIDYNFFVLFNVLWIIYIELKIINETKTREEILIASKKDIFLGVLAGICICSKQTTGAFVAIALVLHNILYVSNFKEFKAFIKKAIYRILGVLIPLIFLAIYFTINKLWNDFIDYCILGIGTFSNSIPYSNLLKNSNIYIKTLSIIVPVFIISVIGIVLVKKYKKKEFDKKLLVIISYAIAEIVVVYPIADDIHFLVGALPTIIGIIYVISTQCKKIKDEKIKVFIKEYIKAFNILVTTICVVASINLLYNYIIQARQYTTLSHFNYILQSQEQINDIKEVEEYIQNQDKNVYILDAASAIYTIPINQYTKNYDMFMKGNFGANGEDGIIENLRDEENYIVLIKNDKYSRNWQNPEKVRTYIIENMNKVGEIKVFDIYEK